MKRLAIFLFLLFPASAAIAGPFGLEVGMPLAKLRVLESNGDGSYMVSVPQPHPAFDSYIAKVSPRFGLCKIVGLGKTLLNDAYGSQARQEFESLYGSLIAKYGTAKKYDFLNYKSIWNEPNDWAMAVHKKERSLSAYWDRDEGSNIPSEIYTIALHARSLSMDKTYITLNYELSNFEQCSAEQKSTADSAL
jgi:hypothetical protein